MTITAEQIAELLGRAEKHNTRSSMAGSATLIWDLAEAVKALSAGPDRMITDSNEAQREIDDLTAQVEALAAERDDLRAKLAAAEAALVPFAVVANELDGAELPDGLHTCIFIEGQIGELENVTLGDFRRARAALAQEQPQ